MQNNLPLDGPMDLMTVKQLAAYLGVSKIWVYQHYKTLPHIRLGERMIRFRKKDIDEALADAEQGKKTQAIREMVHQSLKRLESPKEEQQ